MATVRVTIERGFCFTDAIRTVAKSGKIICKFSVVTSKSKNVNNEWINGPGKFWNCVAFDDMAEHCSSRLKKKTPNVCIEGELNMYETEEGKAYESLIVSDLWIWGDDKQVLTDGEDEFVAQITGVEDSLFEA